MPTWVRALRSAHGTCRALADTGSGILNFPTCAFEAGCPKKLEHPNMILVTTDIFEHRLYEYLKASEVQHVREEEQRDSLRSYVLRPRYLGAKPIGRWRRHAPRPEDREAERGELSRQLEQEREEPPCSWGGGNVCPGVSAGVGEASCAGASLDLAPCDDGAHLGGSGRWASRPPDASGCGCTYWAARRSPP